MLYRMVYDKRAGRTKYNVRRLVSSVDGWKISDCGKDECVIEYVQIVKERIEYGANEKTVLRFSLTVLSFASISIFPG